MRSKSIVLILIAAVCGTVAATGVSQAIRSPAAAPAVEQTAKIFVAAKEIDIREAFSAENIRLEEWPKSKVPEGAIIELAEIEGRYSRTRLYEGEVILEKKLMSKDEVGSHEITIPPGYRVKSVQVSMESAVSNLVMPGSRVDVLVFLKEGNEVAKTGAYTILENVRVFAVNDKVNREISEDGQTLTAKTVSLLVKPDQVEKLLVASSVGRLELSLRRPDDETDEQDADDDMTALSELLRQGAESGVEPVEKPQPPRPAAENFAEFLRQGGARAAEPAPVVEANLPTMLVMSPDGVKQFRWTDPTQLPEEVQEDFTGASAPIAPALPAPVAPDPTEGVAAGPAVPEEAEEEPSEGPKLTPQ
jgi:pilus assembly protein CpaB